jgi:hypothetical protein
VIGAEVDYIHRPSPLLEWRFQKFGRVEHPCVIDQDIEPAEALHRGSYHQLGIPGNISLDKGGTPTTCHDLGRNGLTRSLLNICNDYRRALTSQR